MLFLTSIAVLVSVAVAQEPKSSGFNFGNGVAQIQRILDGASMACNNKYIAGPYIEGVFCGGLIPQQYIDLVDEKLGLDLKFGEDSAWCSGLACAYRAMGCPDPTYRIEARIIKATGRHESCGTKVGLDAAKCGVLAKFIAKAPAAAPTKRSVEEEEEEAKTVARLAMKAWMPEEYKKLDFESIGEPSDAALESRKRQAGIIDQVQACSPLIALGLEVLGSNLNLPINITTILGPCGVVCDYALCGLNVLCHAQAEPLLTKVNAERIGGLGGKTCEPLRCADFIKAPESKCMGITCNAQAGQYEPGFFSTTSNCAPPAQIITPQRTSPDDCCETCKNDCQGVPCTTTLESCGTDQQWPICYDPVLAKADPYDCCPQCLNPCYAFDQQNKANIAAGQGDLCGAPPPTSCPAGQVLGPGRPGDCCFKCNQVCAGVSCTGTPQSATDCPACHTFVPRPTTPAACQDCCGRCVPDAFCETQGTTSASTSFLAAAVVAVSVVLMSL